MLFKFFAALYGSLPARNGKDHAVQLRAMSDLELRDLGIGRSEIPAVFAVQEDEDRWGNRAG